MVAIFASNTLRYQNDPQINVTTGQTNWTKTQTITITVPVIGTMRFSYGFGANQGCYGSPGGCIGTQIRKSAAVLGEWWPADGIGSNIVDLSITLNIGDIVELWVRNGDGNFSTYTNTFRISYDILVPSATTQIIIID